MQYEFDHLVLMARDRVDTVAASLLACGFSLTPQSRHNLGSVNRLAILGSTYLEVLGWESGHPPQRKEIADEPLGLNALVFRTSNADQCHRLLTDAGFHPNAVQELSRPAVVGDDVKTALFRTVRFSQQPIAGLRIYFCQHVTPELVWQSRDMVHSNNVSDIEEIVISAPNPVVVHETLQRLLGRTSVAQAGVSGREEPFAIELGNTRVSIIDADIAQAQVTRCLLKSSTHTASTVLDAGLFCFEKTM